jgi:hypothetical protein
MATVRSQRRAVDALTNAAAARQYADAGVQLAAQWIASDSNWRSSRVSGVWLNNKAFDRGTITVRGTDPLDGDLTNRPYDKLLIRSEGGRGGAKQIAEMTMIAQGRPIDALSLALHVAGELHVKLRDHADGAGGAGLDERNISEYRHGDGRVHAWRLCSRER